MNSFLPDSNFNIRVTKFDFLNGLINNEDKVKFEIVPKPLKIKRIYKVTQDQAQILFMTLMSRIDSL